MDTHDIRQEMTPLDGVACSGPTEDFAGAEQPQPNIDVDLVARVLQGDQNAFESLMKRHAPVVLGYVAGRFRSNADLDDLLQETFLTAYRELGALRDPTRLGPWLIRIARNKCIDLQRRRNARPRIAHVDDAGPDAVDQAQAPGLDPARSAALEETRGAVIDAIGQLSERYRSIVYLHLIGELPPSDIAERLGLRHGMVRMRLMRGLRAVRERLESRGIR